MYTYTLVNSLGQSIILGVEGPFEDYGKAYEHAMVNLASQYYGSSYPIEIRFHKDYSLEYTEELTVQKYDVDTFIYEHKQKINSPAILDAIVNAESLCETLKYQYSQGLITPSDYAINANSAWTSAQYNIDKELGI